MRHGGRQGGKKTSVAVQRRAGKATQDKEKGIEVDTGKEKVAVGVPAKQRDIFIRMIPMGRAGTPEEAAGAIMFFASPLSDYVSGQLLICGGGFSM